MLLLGIWKEKYMQNNKIIVILGPTASGKSGTAIKLAKKFNGEIISADSRQIYRGMDIGTGKIESDFPSAISKSKLKISNKDKPFISSGIPHYAIDIVSPRTDYNVATFKKYADRVITDILSRGKVPIIAGGTGFWIKSIVDNVTYPEVAPDPVLRFLLRNKTTEELFSMLQKLDPVRAVSIDAKNPVRLVRAIEICKTLGKVPRQGETSDVPNAFGHRMSKIFHKEFLQIGILRGKEALAERIKLNIKKRFEAGMISEVEKLHAKGLSWKKIESFGLSYRLIPQFLRGEIKSEEDLLEKIYLAEKDYAKRQLTWFKKDKRIIWMTDYEKIEKTVQEFLVSSI